MFYMLNEEHSNFGFDMAAHIINHGERNETLYFKIKG